MGHPVRLCLAGRRPWLTFVVIVGTIIGSRHIHAAPLHGNTTDHGCYHMLQHYNEGDNIPTNEPCLNCTCRNSALKCFLQACPFAKPIGQDCVVERGEDQCCPTLTCPPVPVVVDALHGPPATSTARTPTSAPSSFHGTSMELSSGCNIDGTFYPDGAQVPGDPSDPCQLCYCIQNHTACILQQCTLDRPGCSPVYREGICCPIRYDCGSERSSTTTTTTTTVRPIGCTKDGHFYEDGSPVPGDESCEFCYCMGGDIVCALPGCPPPPDQFGFNEGTCVELALEPGQCCPVFNCSRNPGTGTDLRNIISDEPITEESLTTENPGTVPGTVEKMLERFVGSSGIPGSIQKDELITESYKADGNSLTEGPGILENEDPDSVFEFTDVPVQIVFSLSLLQNQPLEHRTEAPEFSSTLSTEPSNKQGSTKVEKTDSGTILEQSGASVIQESPPSSNLSKDASFIVTPERSSDVLEQILSADIVTEKFQAVIREPNTLETLNFTTLEMNDSLMQTAPVTTEGAPDVPEAGQRPQKGSINTGELTGDFRYLKEAVLEDSWASSTVPGSLLEDGITTEIALEDLEATISVPVPFQSPESEVKETADSPDARNVRLPEGSGFFGDSEDSKSSRMFPEPHQAQLSGMSILSEDSGISSGSLQSDSVPDEGSGTIPGFFQVEEMSTEVAFEGLSPILVFPRTLQEEISSTEVVPREAGIESFQSNALGSNTVPETLESLEWNSKSLQTEETSTEVVPGGLDKFPGIREDFSSTEAVPEEPVAASQVLQNEEQGSNIVSSIPEGSGEIPGSLQAEELSTEVVSEDLAVSQVSPGSLHEKISSTEASPEELEETFQNKEYAVPAEVKDTTQVPGSYQTHECSTEHPVDPETSPGIWQTANITTQGFHDDVEAPHVVPGTSSQAAPVEAFVPVTPGTPRPATSSIPGEEACLVDGVTYYNEEEVPGSDPCQVHCRCHSSIVTCKMITCSPPPADFSNCKPSVRPGKCCPAYDCDGLHGALPGTPGMTSTLTLGEIVMTPEDNKEESLIDPESQESQLNPDDSVVSHGEVVENLKSSEFLNNEDVEINTEDSQEDSLTTFAHSGENHEDSQLNHDSPENLEPTVTMETVDRKESSFIPVKSQGIKNSGSPAETGENQESSGESGNIEESLPSEKLYKSFVIPSDAQILSKTETENHEFLRNLYSTSTNPDDLGNLNDSQVTVKNQESSETHKESFEILSDSLSEPQTTANSSPSDSVKESSVILSDSEILSDANAAPAQESLENPRILHPTIQRHESLSKSGFLTENHDDSGNHDQDSQSPVENQESSGTPKESLQIPNVSEIPSDSNPSPAQESLENPRTLHPETKDHQTFHDPEGMVADDSMTHTDSESESLLALESAAIDSHHPTKSAPFPVDPLTSAPTCLYEGRVYLSAQQILRSDPCDFCFCFRGDIICLQQSCPPPLRGCFQEPIPGYCCPRYECPVLQVNHNTSLAVVLRPGIDETSTREGSAGRRGCQLGGDFYEVGQLVKEASGPCLTCRCGHHSLMECDPQQCQPEPLLRKVIAFSSDKRRRRAAASDGIYWLD